MQTGSTVKSMVSRAAVVVASALAVPAALVWAAPAHATTDGVHPRSVHPRSVLPTPALHHGTAPMMRTPSVSVHVPVRATRMPVTPA